MPNDGVAFDWHRDIQHRDKGNGTWHDVTGRGSFVQTILLVDDMTEDNGPLKFRSRAGEVATVTGRAGDVLFFGPYAEHGSLPNESRSPRRVLINGYAAPGANRRVYPGRGAGRLLR
jgi:ectoine hydroxylase-related dioxygenase (phytanoyl-CoA dioxygenase family)